MFRMQLGVRLVVRRRLPPEAVFIGDSRLPRANQGESVGQMAIVPNLGKWQDFSKGNDEWRLTATILRRRQTWGKIHAVQQGK